MGGVTVIADTGPPPRIELPTRRTPDAFPSSCLPAAATMSSTPAWTPMAPPNSGRWPAPRPPIRQPPSTTPRQRVSATRCVSTICSARRSSAARTCALQAHRPARHPGFLARHDGYVARFGLLHERELKLSKNGNVLAGRDRLLRPGGAAIRNNGRDFVTVRFHIHPDIELLQDEHDRLALTAQKPTPGCSPAPRSRPRSRYPSFRRPRRPAAAGRSCWPSRHRRFRRSIGN